MLCGKGALITAPVIAREGVCFRIGTHFQLGAHTLRELLSVSLEEFSCRLEGFEVLLVTDLSVSYGHEVSHDFHQACIIAI